MHRWLKNEKDLLNILKDDIKSTDKDTIVFLAGHFPLIYTEEGAIPEINRWGEFSLYSLELACKLAQFANKKLDKKIKFVFFVDDHIYEKVDRLTNLQVRLKRRSFYKKASGPKAQLIKTYQKILDKYGFSEKDIIRQDQGKNNRDDCIYFSEKILRTSKRPIKNICAIEYIEFLENSKYFNKKKYYQISFIPNRCKDNICTYGLDTEIKDLSSSHIFIETTAPTISRAKLYGVGRGISYRKN